MNFFFKPVKHKSFIHLFLVFIVNIINGLFCLLNAGKQFQTKIYLIFYHRSKKKLNLLLEYYLIQVFFCIEIIDSKTKHTKQF